MKFKFTCYISKIEEYHELLKQYGIEEVFFVCITIEVFYYFKLKTCLPSTQYVFIGDTIEADKFDFIEEEKSIPRDIYCLLYSYENIIKDTLRFFCYMKEAVENVSCNIHPEGILVFRYTGNHTLRYNIGYDHQNIHSLIATIVERLHTDIVKNNIHEILMPKKEKLKEFIKTCFYFPSSVYRILSALILNGIQLLARIYIQIFSFLKKDANVYVLVGNEINIKYLDEYGKLKKGSDNSALLLYASKYVYFHNWLKENIGYRRIIIPLVFPPFLLLQTMLPFSHKKILSTFKNQITIGIKSKVTNIISNPKLHEVIEYILSLYLEMKMYDGLLSIVRSFENKTDIISYEGGQTAGYGYFLEKISLETQQNIRNIDVMYHGSINTVFDFKRYKGVINNEKMRFFVRNMIEYDILNAGGIKNNNIYVCNRDMVLETSPVNKTITHETTRDSILEKYGLCKNTKKVLLLSASGTLLSDEIDIKKNFNAIEMLLDYLDHKDMEIMIKPHPRYDYYNLLGLLTEKYHNTHLYTNYNYGEYILTKGNKQNTARIVSMPKYDLDELLFISDLVVGAGIFNSAMLRSVYLKRPTIYLTSALMDSNYAKHSFDKYFYCSTNMQSIYSTIDSILSTESMSKNVKHFEKLYNIKHLKSDCIH